MSEQAQIIAMMNEVIMNILKSGSVSEEEGAKINYLEDLLHAQACFKVLPNTEDTYQGEEIANLFFTTSKDDAIAKMLECKITPDDFFGFIDYHYDDEHEDEKKAEIFTNTFRFDVNTSYQSKV